MCVNRYIECIMHESSWSRTFSLVVACSLYKFGVVRSIPVGVLGESFFTDFSPTTLNIHVC